MRSDNFTTSQCVSYIIHREPNSLIVSMDMYHFLGEVLPGYFYKNASFIEIVPVCNLFDLSRADMSLIGQSY